MCGRTTDADHSPDSYTADLHGCCVKLTGAASSYFASGRTPKLGQFALTPEQLSIREYYESLTDEFEGTSPRAPTYTGEGYTGGARSMSSELDVFPSIQY